ncbi:proline-rich protein 23E [Camelus bactrianus]|uniref:Proline-rich protein 23E n=1 Tax=Camelus bactrianus TaxID=9837 RepID=A0AC58NR08_CAMBA
MMGTAISWEGAAQTLKTPDHPPKDIQVPPAASGAASYPDLRAQSVTGPACWPDMRPSWAAPSWMGRPAPWSYMCTPSIGHLWIGYPCPAASAPSVWTWGVSCVDPLVGRQHAAPLASGVFPYPAGPPPPYPSDPPAPSGDASGHCTQEGWQTPASSVPPAAVEGPSRGASYLTTYQVLPSEWASRLSIWAPKPSSSPELCPLPPSPSGDPQGEPRCPQLPRPPSRVCRRLFQH